MSADDDRVADFDEALWWRDRAEKAEAALARVEKLADEWDSTVYHKRTTAELRAAIRGGDDDA